MNTDAAITTAFEQLVDYETGHCTYDGWNSTPCCTAWGPALRLLIMEKEEFEQAIRKIVDAAQGVTP